MVSFCLFFLHFEVLHNTRQCTEDGRVIIHRDGPRADDDALVIIHRGALWMELGLAHRAGEWGARGPWKYPALAAGKLVRERRRRRIAEERGEPKDLPDRVIMAANRAGGQEPSRAATSSSASILCSPSS